VIDDALDALLLQVDGPHGDGLAALASRPAGAARCRRRCVAATADNQGDHERGKCTKDHGACIASDRQIPTPSRPDPRLLFSDAAHWSGIADEAASTLR
jgi:hypothetical protein